MHSFKGPAKFRLAILSLALGLAPAAFAQLTNFEVIDYPSAVTTTALGLNNAGDIVGGYQLADKKRHGYL